MAAAQPTPDQQQQSHWRSSDDSARYRNSRPPYPPPMFDTVLAQVQTSLDDRGPDGARKTRLLDIACGTGQVLQGVASKFDEVFATDLSETQVQNAQQFSNVTYVTGAAETFELPGGNQAHYGTFDLITIGSALHWFDAAAFAKHVAPLLRPHGVVAAFQPYFAFNEPAASLEKELFAFLEEQGCWARESVNRWNHHADQLPQIAEHLEVMPLEKFERSFEGQSVEMFAGVTATISAIQTYYHKHPDAKAAAVAEDAVATGYTPGCNAIGVFRAKLKAQVQSLDGTMSIPIHLFRRKQSQQS